MDAAETLAALAPEALAAAPTGAPATAAAADALSPPDAGNAPRSSSPSTTTRLPRYATAVCVTDNAPSEALLSRVRISRSHSLGF